MESDLGTLKGDFARARTFQDARNIASDMGLTFVRTLNADELNDMAGNTLLQSRRPQLPQRRLGDRSNGRDGHPLHSDGSLVHRRPQGLQPCRP